MAWKAPAPSVWLNSVLSDGVESANQPMPAAFGLRTIVPAVGKPFGPTASMRASPSSPFGRSARLTLRWSGAGPGRRPDQTFKAVAGFVAEASRAVVVRVSASVPEATTVAVSGTLVLRVPLSR